MKIASFATLLFALVASAAFAQITPENFPRLPSTMKFEFQPDDTMRRPFTVTLTEVKQEGSHVSGTISLFLAYGTASGACSMNRVPFTGYITGDGKTFIFGPRPPTSDNTACKGFDYTVRETAPGKWGGRYRTAKSEGKIEQQL